MKAKIDMIFHKIFRQEKEWKETKRIERLLAQIKD